MTWPTGFRAVMETPSSIPAIEANVQPLILPSLWCRSDTYHLLLLWWPVLPHHPWKKQCTVRNCITEMDLRSPEWSRKWSIRKCILC
jgi:hypothetical protein